MDPGGRQPVSDDPWRRLAGWEPSFDAQLDRLASELVAVRRHLHAHPEASGEEVETSRFLQLRLARAGLEARLCSNGSGLPTGVIADLTVGTPARDCPRIALRADLDALRMPDEKTVEYRSQNPSAAHACGHDAHAAIVLGAAVAAVGLVRPAAADGLPGLKLRFLFQPAEETSEGAQWLVEQGAMDEVDFILGLHVDPERRVGEVGVRYGTLTANCDEMDILIEGHGGHAARPHHSVDPIAAAAHLVSALYEYLPRSVDSRNASVFTVGRIVGGYAHNVIPERVELQATLRTTHLESRQRLLKRLTEICRGVEQASGTRIEVTFLRPLGAVENDPRVMAALEAASRRVLGPAGVRRLEQPSMGGEDFSVYLEHAPGALLRLGCATPGEQAPFLHSPLFDVDERCLALGARILLRAAALLSEPESPRWDSERYAGHGD